MKKEESMRRALPILAIAALLGLPQPANAADAYIVRFLASGQELATGGHLFWRDDVLFANTGASPATIRFVEASNGVNPQDAPSLTLGPGEVGSLRGRYAEIDRSWTAGSAAPMWILHLDVPSGVVVESRDEFYVSFGLPELFPAPRGKVSLPIFRSLTVAGRPQVHLGTDLIGSDSRLNVTVYNGGDQLATATIEVRRVCDGALVDKRTSDVPAKTALQIGGITVGANGDCPIETAGTRYTVITVTQPSFTFVSNVNDRIDRDVWERGIVPIVGLAVADNARF